MGQERTDLLPPPDEEYRLAHRLLGEEDDLDRRVLTTLVGRPRRFSELESILSVGPGNNLTAALSRLRSDGVIEQRIDARRCLPIHQYELTQLGVLVVFRMYQMLPARESAEALRRGRATRNH